MEKTLRRVLADDQISVTPIEPPKPSPASPLTPAIMHAIERVSEKLWPGMPVVPVMETGATDGLFLRNAGIPTFGIDGTFSDIDDVRMHGRDERIGVKQYFEGLEFQYRLLKALTGP